MAIELILLSKCLETSVESTLVLVNFVMQNLNVLLQVRVAIECFQAQFTLVGMFVLLTIMLRNFSFAFEDQQAQFASVFVVSN
jgi:hypothetical protein